jgi:hypothetical protein
MLAHDILAFLEFRGASWNLAYLRLSVNSFNGMQCSSEEGGGKGSVCFPWAFFVEQR